MKQTEQVIKILTGNLVLGRPKSVEQSSEGHNQTLERSAECKINQSYLIG